MENEIAVIQKISFARIADVLCGAVDPGHESIAYWGEVKKKINPTMWKFDERPVYMNPADAEANINVHYRHYYPLNPAGALVIRDNEEGKDHLLDLGAIKKGLSVMAEKYPEHFADIIKENEDGDTSDILVQCSLFGDVIYS